MRRRPPISNRTDSPLPYTPLCRPDRHAQVGEQRRGAADHRVLGLPRGILVPVEDIVVLDVLARRPARQAVPRGTIDATRHQPGLLDAELGQPLQYRRSEEHTSELQSLMPTSYAVFCLTKKKN